MEYKDGIIYLDPDEYQIVEEKDEQKLSSEEVNYLLSEIYKLLIIVNNKTLGLPQQCLFSQKIFSFREKLEELKLIKILIEYYQYYSSEAHNTEREKTYPILQLDDKSIYQEQSEADINRESSKLDSIEDGNQDSSEQQESKKSEFLDNISDIFNKNKKEATVDEKLQVGKDSEKVDEIVIKNLISRFLKLYFKVVKTDLNERRKTDLEKIYGYYYWDKKRLARHLTTKEYTKVLNDRYDMQYSKGKGEAIPLAFYFDLSGSMSAYTTVLAQIAYVLLKNDIKVLIGYNSTIYKQINQIGQKATITDLKEVLTMDSILQIKTNENVQCEPVNTEVDDYLLSKNCQKCVIFSDNDSYDEVCNLSEKCDVYYLYFATYGPKIDEKFKGSIFIINNKSELFEALRTMSRMNYQTLKQKSLILKKEGNHD